MFPTMHLLASVVAGIATALACPTSLDVVFADMHDGDQKRIILNGDSLTIKPHGNNQTWEVKAVLKSTMLCNAIVNFNVPGKPNPPPVDLEVNLWMAKSTEPLLQKKWTLEFRDPSGKLAAPTSILNSWIQLGAAAGPGDFCPKHFTTVFADMHDGDKKEVTISGTALTIKPHGSKEDWLVKAILDQTSCSAVIDFKVPGKPNPPPVSLSMDFWTLGLPSGNYLTLLEFSDPSGTIGSKGTPLNAWIEAEYAELLLV